MSLISSSKNSDHSSSNRRVLTPTLTPSTPPQPFTIVVEGNIGAGKTTFLEQFMVHKKDKNLVEVYAEPVDKWRDVQGNNSIHGNHDQEGHFIFYFITL